MVHGSKLTRGLTSMSMDKFKGHFGKAYGGFGFSTFCHCTNGFHMSRRSLLGVALHRLLVVLGEESKIVQWTVELQYMLHRLKAIILILINLFYFFLHLSIILGIIFNVLYFNSIFITEESFKKSFISIIVCYYRIRITLLGTMKLFVKSYIVFT